MIKLKIITVLHVLSLFISPSGLSYEDTYNTLKYADRAMNITCKVVKNELSVDMHVSRYAKIVEELRLEVKSWSVLNDNHLVKKSS